MSEKADAKFGKQQGWKAPRRARARPGRQGRSAGRGRQGRQGQTAIAPSKTHERRSLSETVDETSRRKPIP
jgi:hypothetical protein